MAQQNRVQQRLGLTVPQVFEGPLALPQLTPHSDAGGVAGAIKASPKAPAGSIKVQH